MKEEERLKYYLGKYYDKKNIFKTDNIKLKKGILTNSKEINNDTKSLQKTDNLNYDFYVTHVKNLLKTRENTINKFVKKIIRNSINETLYNVKKHNNFLFLYGDYNKNNYLIPALCKTRYLKQNNVLLNFKRFRHMNLVYLLKKYPKLDIPFEKKYNICIWRGSTTGSKKNIANRFQLVEKYYKKKEKIDIGFCKDANININDHVKFYKTFYSNKDYFKLSKKALNIEELLKYKYLISVEGNDVASGLKWMLYSNSVVLMAKPRNFSWIMEDKLIPNFHYILLKDDFSDLEEKIEWCNDNQLKCLNISKNATEYMKQFLDIKKEYRLEKNVLDKYLQNVIII
jgi:hypothetical protein